MVRFEQQKFLQFLYESGVSAFHKDQREIESPPSSTSHLLLDWCCASPDQLWRFVADALLDVLDRRIENKNASFPSQIRLLDHHLTQPEKDNFEFVTKYLGDRLQEELASRSQRNGHVTRSSTALLVPSVSSGYPLFRWLQTIAHPDELSDLVVLTDRCYVSNINPAFFRGCSLEQHQSLRSLQRPSVRDVVRVIFPHISYHALSTAPDLIDYAYQQPDQAGQRTALPQSICHGLQRTALPQSICHGLQAEYLALGIEPLPCMGLGYDDSQPASPALSSDSLPPPPPLAVVSP